MMHAGLMVCVELPIDGLARMSFFYYWAKNSTARLTSFLSTSKLFGQSDKTLPFPVDRNNNFFTLFAVSEHA